MKQSIKMCACATLLLALTAQGQTFSDPTPFSIPVIGAASPYPGTISVDGLSGSLASVEVRLMGLTHSFPADLDILLVGPTGANVVLMSDAGADANVFNVDLTFHDGAALLPESQIITPGAYRPTNHEGSPDNFLAPAPAGPYGNLLSVFSGLNPNGAWRLFVVDQGTPDSGQLGGGWELKMALSSGPAITYQGRLKQGGVPFNGTADFRFRLLNSASEQVGAVQDVVGMAVTNGSFTTLLHGTGEFGPDAFIGEPRFLEVSVAAPSGGGLVTLAPLQMVTAAPLSHFAYDSGFAVESAHASEASSTPWAGIRGMPGDFTDGVDNVGGGVAIAVVAGDGLSGGVEGLERGVLVSMTGENRSLAGPGEVLLGVEVSSKANDPACLGAYLAPQGSGQVANQHQIMSVGSGELWVIETGRDIVPGDALISSATLGCAMLDDPARFPEGHVVARAAQVVNWASLNPGPDGLRRARISVLFDRYTRGADAETMVLLKSQLEETRTLNRDLESRIQRLEQSRQINP